jgi:hypothetical protein
MVKESAMVDLPYLSEKAHCTAISSNLQPLGGKKDSGLNFLKIPLRQWEIPLKEGNLGGIQTS